MSIRWMEIEIKTTQEASDAICELLAQFGADGISVCDPMEMRNMIMAPDSLSYADDGFLDSFGEEVIIKAYFAEFSDGIRMGAKAEEYQNPEGVGQIYGHIAKGSHSPEEVREMVKTQLDTIAAFLPIGEGLSGYRFVNDEDWANNWKQYYDVMKISPRVVICPSWKDYEKEENEEVIFLDPGSAFGTGSHETTSMCIQLLDEYIRPEDTVLDVGCGSGILSIVASKLGASYVEAIDIDRLAVDVAVENCQKNEAEVLCHSGELSSAKKGKYSLIVANIVAEVIANITPEIPQYLEKNGFFLISGIIDTKKEQVIQACENAGLRQKKAVTKNDWWAFLYEM